MNSLARRLALPIVGFVVAGSLALVWWLGREAERVSRETFASMARTNADFIRKENLPLSDRTAAALSEVLGVGVYFASAGTAPEIQSTPITPELLALPMRAPGVVSQLPGLPGEVVALPIANGASMYLYRPTPSRTGFLTEKRTLVLLGVFWVLSLGLAWVLAQGLVRPLRAFAARLPRIAEEKGDPIPEVARKDEIGQLARAYSETRAQLAAERTAREQAERLATLGRMATGLAHEINNPVAAIKLHAQLLEMEVTGTPPERLGIILAESAKIEGLVSQWMFLARPQPPLTAPCDLSQLVAAGVKSLEPAAQHARVGIINELPPGLEVMADHRRIAQAIANVIINAIHAMAATGGTLTISATRETPTIHLHFTDTGSGFSADALDRATELFYSEKEGGMGIGLNVTAEILRAHNGGLVLKNVPRGSGAVVTMHLPVLHH